MPDIHRLFERDDTPDPLHVGEREIGIFQHNNKTLHYVDHPGNVRTIGSYSGPGGDAIHWGSNDDLEGLHLRLNTTELIVDTTEDPTADFDDYPYGYIAFLADDTTGYMTAETAYMRYNVYKLLEFYTGGFYVDAGSSGFGDSFIGINADVQIGADSGDITLYLQPDHSFVVRNGASVLEHRNLQIDEDGTFTVDSLATIFMAAENQIHLRSYSGQIHLQADTVLNMNGDSLYMGLSTNSQIVAGAEFLIQAATDVQLASGSTAFVVEPAGIRAVNLPTSNPGGSNKIWNDGGTLKIT